MEKISIDANSYVEMLVVYKDDQDTSKTKRLIPIAWNPTHFIFINPKSNKMEIILRNNIIRMEEIKQRLDFAFDPAKYNVILR